jgi:hypothetical protein
VSLLDYPQPFKEAVGTFEVLRKLGFPSEAIFFGVADPSPGVVQVFVALKFREKEFTITLGTVPGTPEEVKATWMDLATQIVNGAVPQSDLNQVWQNCLVRRHSTDFLLALTNKGLIPPKTLN